MNYTGYKTLELSDDELSDLYVGLYEFSDMKMNEYALISNHGEIVDKVCYKGDSFRHVRYPSINDGTKIIAPRNDYQSLAIDLIQDKDIKVKLIRGVYGSGKDYLMTAAALSLINKHKFEKIIFIRPNITVANLPDIGYLPGSVQEKLEWTLGPILDKVGSPEKMKTLITKGSIEMMPLIYIRGRSFENSIIYVTEGQNMNTEMVKLLISRVGEGSELWINGDNDAQCDRQIFSKDNGLLTLAEKLQGQELFGTVYLPITERSSVARLCDLLN